MIRRKSYKTRSGRRVKSSCVKDMGKPGRTPKHKRVLPKPSGDMSLSEFGYKVSKSEEDRRNALVDAVKEYGALVVLRHLNLLRNYQSVKRNKQRMSDDVEYLKRKYATLKRKRSRSRKSSSRKSRSRKSRSRRSRKPRSRSRKSKKNKKNRRRR